MSRLKIFFIGLTVLALALSVGPAGVKAYDGAEPGEAGIQMQPLQIDDSGKCVFKKSKFVAGRSATQTTSTDFVPVELAQITFTTKRKGCLRITFNAEAWAPLGTTMFVEARVDGSTDGVVPSGDKQFISRGASASAEYQTIVLTKKDVRAGTHTVEMFFRSSNGQGVNIYDFHLSVDYKR